MKTLTNQSVLRIIVGGTIGNVTEWYNFMLYGFLAPVISNLFFPTNNKLLSLSFTFTLFAVSFLVRPIGGMLFGWIGDVYGRQRALLASLMLMSVPTFLIGCLPTYATLGVISPILLCVLRVCQGLSAGGEHTGSAVYVAEYAPQSRRSFWVSSVPVSAAIGLLFSNIVSLIIVNSFTEQELLSYGWRSGYWVGTLLCIISLYLRYYLPESPFYEKLERQHKVDRAPVSTLFTDKVTRKNFFLVFLLASCYGVFYQIIFIWMPTFLAEFSHRSSHFALQVNAVFMLLFVCLMLTAGWVADRISRKKIVVLSGAALFLGAYPAFTMLSSGATLPILVAMSWLTLSFSFSFPTAFVMMLESFQTRVRYTGLSLSYNLGLALFGGTCPLLVTWLIHLTGNTVAPAFYMMLCALLTMVLATKLIDKRQLALT